MPLRQSAPVNQILYAALCSSVVVMIPITDHVFEAYLKCPAATATLQPGLFRRGYIESWNLTTERKLPRDFVATAAYVATHAVRPLMFEDINASAPGLGTAGRPYFAKYGRTLATTLVQPDFGVKYQSLQATLNRRFSNGLFAKFSHTFAHGINFTDNSLAV